MCTRGSSGGGGGGGGATTVTFAGAGKLHQAKGSARQTTIVHGALFHTMQQLRRSQLRATEGVSTAMTHPTASKHTHVLMFS